MQKPKHLLTSSQPGWNLVLSFDFGLSWGAGSCRPSLHCIDQLTHKIVRYNWLSKNKFTYCRPCLLRWFFLWLVLVEVELAVALTATPTDSNWLDCELFADLERKVDLFGLELLTYFASTSSSRSSRSSSIVFKPQPAGKGINLSVMAHQEVSN